MKQYYILPYEFKSRAHTARSLGEQDVGKQVAKGRSKRGSTVVLPTDSIHCKEQDNRIVLKGN